MRRSRTIRTWLITIMLLLSFLSLAAFALLSQMRLSSALKVSLNERVEAALERSNRCLTLTLEKYRILLWDLCLSDDLIQMVEEYIIGEGDREWLEAEIRQELRQAYDRNEDVVGLAVFAGDGTCICSDGLIPSYGLWTGQKLGLAWEGANTERYLAPQMARSGGGSQVCAFAIQRKLIDLNSYKTLGSVLICVKESALREAVKGGGDEFFCIELDGRVISAPEDEMLGSSIAADGVGRIGDTEYPQYKTAVLKNEMCGWNIVEFYPLEAFLSMMRGQFGLLLLMLLATGIVLVFSVIFATRPVITSIEALLLAMQEVEKGNFSARVEKKRNMPEEIEKIADGFNIMVERTDLLLNQMQRAALEQKNAEISALEAQIDPHFLYNTLDTINWKAISHEEYEISEMVGDLADILRYAIKNAGGITTLGQEVAWLRKYVRLQQEKLGKKIQVFGSITSEAAGCPMHKLLLQPFVENSIRHGLVGSDREPILIITGEVDQDTLVIRIRDNGKGLSPERLAFLNSGDYHREDHFGVENVRKRLHLYYGELASVSFASVPGEYMEVTVRVPVWEEGPDENRDRGG